MKKEAPVTAVIPTYNRRELVVQAVESVLAQTAVPSQIIVVDDGSTDRTSEALASYGARIQYFFQPNQGVSVARNRGIAEARNDFIAFLDSDDIWHPRKVERQLAVFSERPELGLLWTGCFALPVASFPELPDQTSLEPLTWRQLVIRSHFTTSTMMIRRAVLTRVGVFDPELRRAEDRDLYIRVAKVFPVASLNLPLTGFGPTADSLSLQIDNMREGGEKLLQKLRSSSEPLEWLLWRQALSYLDYNCANTCELTGFRVRAIGYLLQSLARYPFLYPPGVMQTRFARLKRLLVLFWRLIRHEPPEFVLTRSSEHNNSLKRQGLPVQV